MCTARVVGEGVLHAVAMVRVEIDVEHAFQATLEQRQDGEDRIVEVAEAARPVGPAVVRAAGRVEHRAPFEREFGREDRAADGRRGALEDAGEKRVLQGAEAETLAHEEVTCPAASASRKAVTYS